jgi:hypothetical protein
MQNVILGAVGVLAVLALLALGAALGWRARSFWMRHIAQAQQQELTEQEKRAFQAQQRAFDELMGYSADIAYGMDKSLDELAREVEAG